MSSPRSYCGSKRSCSSPSSRSKSRLRMIGSQDQGFAARAGTAVGPQLPLPATMNLRLEKPRKSNGNCTTNPKHRDTGNIAYLLSNIRRVRHRNRSRKLPRVNHRTISRKNCGRHRFESLEAMPAAGLFSLAWAQMSRAYADPPDGLTGGSSSSSSFGLVNQLASMERLKMLATTPSETKTGILYHSTINIFTPTNINTSASP